MCDLGGGDVRVRRIPYWRAAPKDDHLRGLVPHARPGGDLLRQGASRAHVHEEKRHIQALLCDGFDLFQGRQAEGSGRAVFIQRSRFGAEQPLHVLLGLDSQHVPSIGEAPLRTSRPNLGSRGRTFFLAADSPSRRYCTRAGVAMPAAPPVRLQGGVGYECRAFRLWGIPGEASRRSEQGRGRLTPEGLFS